MRWLLIIDAVGAFTILAIWYWWFSCYNRRRGLLVLDWVKAACLGRGSVTTTHWIGSSRLLAELRFPPPMFEHARVVVRLIPRAIPVNWALSRWRKEKETLSFEADLDSAPRFHLEALNHRWSGHNSRSLMSRNWIVSRPGPVVLTSRTKWGQELSPVINALMVSRERNFVSIRFSPDSPHFSATLDIDSLSAHPTEAGFLETLRELASRASASRQ